MFIYNISMEKPKTEKTFKKLTKPELIDVIIRLQKIGQKDKREDLDEVEC